MTGIIIYGILLSDDERFYEMKLVWGIVKNQDML